MKNRVSRRPPSDATAAGIWSFVLVWTGQVISLFGTSLSGFALGVWIYQTTGSVTRFAIIALATALPRILLAPIVGAVVDRWDRKRVMLLGDTGAALTTLGVLLMLSFAQLAPWHIYLATALASVCSAAQAPAYAASITMLIPERHLGRANGLVQFGEALARIGAPLTAAVFLSLWGLRVIIAIDLLSFAFAFVTLLVVHIPRPAHPDPESARRRRLGEDIGRGWRYLRERKGLLALLVLFTANNFFIGAIEVLVTPLVLATGTVTDLGMVMTTGGVGMLIGALAMAVWGGPRRRILGVFGFSAIEGVFILLGGITTNVTVFAIAAFGFFFAVPIENGSTRALLQSTVAPGFQGRVFAIAMALSHAAMPLGYFAAGPLADAVFSPWLEPSGALAGSVGAIIGTGPGRGIGLMFICAGLGYVFLCVLGLGYPRLRHLETEANDAARAA